MEPENAQQQTDPSLWQAVLNWIASMKGNEQTEMPQEFQETPGREGAEVLNAALPEALSGRKGVTKSREKMEYIDRFMKEANQ